MTNAMDDVERIAARLSGPAKRGLEYHASPGRGSSCGGMGTDLNLIFSGLAEIGKDSRLHLTPLGIRVRAILEKGVS